MRFLIILFIVNSFYSSISFAGCAYYPVKDQCVKTALVNELPVDGWNIPKSHMWNSEKEDDVFVKDTELRLNWALPTTYTSHMDQLKQCNRFLNTADVFYHKDWKNSGAFKPKQNESEDDNLRDFMLMFENWRSATDKTKFNKSVLKNYGFASNYRMSAERLFHDSDTGMRKGKGKSVCSALGLCLCSVNLLGTQLSEGAGCVPIGTFEGIDEPLSINGVNYKRTLGNFNLNLSKFKDYDDTCYFLEECGSGDISPKKRCENWMNSREEDEDRVLICDQYSNKCLYRRECILPPSNNNYDFNNLTYKTANGVTESLRCDHDLECGSKKCQRMPKRIKGLS